MRVTSKLNEQWNLYTVNEFIRNLNLIYSLYTTKWVKIQ